MFKQKYVIDIKNLSKSYFSKNDENEIKALKNINLKVTKGSILALLGPNGAGKSTLIGILAGLINKTSGMVKVSDFNLDTHPRQLKLSIGVVPQELVMDPYFTPRETLDFQAGYYGIKSKNFITEEILNSLGLTDKADSYSRTLSGGMKRRLMIAKAMVHSPEVLILDEPTAGVDVELRKSLWDHIKLLNKNGTTILLTTHYLEEAESICNDVAIINKGKIIAKGKTNKLISDIDKKELVISLFKNCDNLNNEMKKMGFKLIEPKKIKVLYKPSKQNAGQLIKKVFESDLKVKEVFTNEPNLEELFIKILKHN